MKTGRELYDHLQQTGTGKERLTRFEEWLADKPEATGEQAMIWMTDNPSVYLRGTIEKVALFLGVPPPGASVTEETENLREQLGIMRQSLADAEAKNCLLMRTNVALRAKVDGLTTKQPRKERQTIGATD